MAHKRNERRLWHPLAINKWDSGTSCIVSERKREATRSSHLSVSSLGECLLVTNEHLMISSPHCSVHYNDATCWLRMIANDWIGRKFLDWIHFSLAHRLKWEGKKYVEQVLVLCLIHGEEGKLKVFSVQCSVLRLVVLTTRMNAENWKLRAEKELSNVVNGSRKQSTK